MSERSATPRPGTQPVSAMPEGSSTSSGVVPIGEAPSIIPGAVVNGKYLVGPLLGEGGVGLVYEAQNLELDEKVALKCLRPQMLVDTAMVARFAREAKAAASIKSEYVATVHDVGTMADGAPYMVMEFLDGKDLGAVIHEQGVLSSRTACEYALQACEALAVAHARGIVHRDIKPENLMLTERAGGMRIVKVLDFGISKTALTGSIFGTDLPSVKTVNLMGTPLYMSPEQMRCTDNVDARSDIWSLGMVLYELLTGTTAFAATTITELCAAILETSPHRIEAHRPDLPPGLVHVIHRCLEKDPAHRYQNVAELALALMPFGPKRARLNVERSIAVLQGAGIIDERMHVLSTMPPSDNAHTDSMPAVPGAPRLPNVTGPALADSVAPETASTPTFTSFRPRTSRTRRAAIAFGLLAFAALIAVFVTRSGRSPSSAESSQTHTAAAAVVATSIAEPAREPSREPALPQASSGSPTPHERTAAPARAINHPRPFANPPVQLPKAAARASASATAPSEAKPAPTGRPAEEPDLGY